MRHLPNLFWLRAFEAAARLQSFSRAAHELHLTPSAISHQVKNLETHFDKVLFVRRNRRVELSIDGQRLYKSLVPLLDALEQLCADTRQAPSADTLNVHCSPSFAVKWLGPRLNNFLQQHSGLTIQLTTDASRPDLYANSDIDVMICYGDTPKPESGLIIDALGTENLVPLCSPHLLKTLSDPQTWYQTLPLINSPLSPVTWFYWFSINGMHAPTSPRVSFDRGAMVIASAVDQMGVALETTRFAEKELANGDLVILPSPSGRILSREIHFLCHRGKLNSHHKIQVFRNWLLTAIRDSDHLNRL